MSETSGISTDDANVVKDSPEKRILGRKERRIIGPLISINALLLISLAFWLYIDRDATAHSTTYLNRIRWWSSSWGEFVPDIARNTESLASKKAMVVGGGFACLALFLGITAIFYRRGRDRVLLPLLAILLAFGWITTASKWDYIRLRGQSADLAQFAAPVGEFAKLFEASWPKDSGDIAGFGAFLAYPYGNPRTLIMLGDANIPGTPLRIAAVERTPGEAIRFQLSGDAPKVWFEWRLGDTRPTAFEGGLQQAITPLEYHEVATNLFIVSYLIEGLEG